ncbi:hypothetical protein P7K49_000451 [Saguinus oedipus]|uniref:guanylate cyclase n=1 Tax=Saguinus oedipus TaxID=9490 RepID=A0ABQ9WC64_SAGOE|nr:hypothetical protein P7K49_000451 [Saguinus oedipus]
MSQCLQLKPVIGPESTQDPVVGHLSCNWFGDHYLLRYHAFQAALLRMKEKYLNISACPVKKIPLGCCEKHSHVRKSQAFSIGTHFWTGDLWLITLVAQQRTLDQEPRKQVSGSVPKEVWHVANAFEPVYPERLWIEEKTFCNAFPFHIVFDELVKQAGVNIQKYVPGLQTQKIQLNEYFSIIHPQITFNIFSIHKFINSQFVLRTRREMMPAAWQSQPTLKLRGNH